MVPTARRHFLADERDCTRDLLEEVGFVLHEGAALVLRPRAFDSSVDLASLARSLDSKRVCVIVATVDGRRSQVDDGSVARELGISLDAELGEVARLVEWPVSDAIKGAAIAEDDDGTSRLERGPLELSLDGGATWPRSVAVNAGGGGWQVAQRVCSRNTSRADRTHSMLKTHPLRSLMGSNRPCPA